jgi:hypothetical protein
MISSGTFCADNAQSPGIYIICFEVDSSLLLDDTIVFDHVVGFNPGKTPSINHQCRA